MSRFLIVGANYAPEPVGNAPYTTATHDAFRWGMVGAAYARDAFDRTRAEQRLVAWAEALAARHPYRDPGNT